MLIQNLIPDNLYALLLLTNELIMTVDTISNFRYSVMINLLVRRSSSRYPAELFLLTIEFKNY